MGCRKRIIATLRSTAGETITEVLVGVLIVGLATVVLATMINVATQVSLTSTAALQGAYEQTGGIDAATGSASAASRAQVVGTSSSWDGSLSWEPQVQLITSNDSDANGYSFHRYELPEPAQGGN